MDNKVQEQYHNWLNNEQVDDVTKQELRGIADQPLEIEDRFYKELDFGTGGLRGLIGAGTNRMNRYTVGRATQGFAQYILLDRAKPHSVVIAYDSRHYSPEFALEAALVMAGNGITAHVFESLRPTPELSFAVRELGASGGIVVTASHNPPEYNGYKVYGPSGGQLVPAAAGQLTEIIGGIASFGQGKRLTREAAESRGLLRWIGEAIDAKFTQAVTAMSVNADLLRGAAPQCKIVYTPLHGAGNLPVRRALEAIGFTQVHVVPEQELPDPNFSTVASPNPEEQEAFKLAIELAEKLQADLIIGTDPDSDRMGAVVKNDKGEYTVLTGNQSGALLIHYLLGSMQEQGKLPSNGVVIKTIVTSEMGAVVAQHYGIETLNTLTGFKFIGQKMDQFERDGSHQFLFGYEESYGYLAGNYARDKDAVLASMLICEAAAFYKSQGKTLYGVLQELYKSFGYFLESQASHTLKGKEGISQIHDIMERWRTQPPKQIAGVNVAELLDYSHGLNGLPPENVLKFLLEDGSWFCLRPSGTEPKIKIYFAVRGSSAAEASDRMEQIKTSVMSF